MPVRRLRQLRSEESGFALIEVLISALIVVLITAAVVQVLTATGRASTEERHRAQAFSVAQEDQARLRSMQISALQQNLEPRVVTVAGTPFTVTSTATYVTDKTGTTKCGGEGKADYVRIGSSVTWPTMHEGQAPIVIESIVSPVSGSVESTSGGLAISLLNSRKEKNGIAGVPVSGKGPATFFGSTNSEGCVLFGGEPTGKYTITPSLPGTGWVDVNGEPPKAFEMSVTGGTTTPKEVHYDKGGGLEAKFEAYEKGTGEYKAAKADAVVAYNVGGRARTFGTPGTARLELVKSEKTLYPFESSYAVWGGSCTTANAALEPEEAAKGFVTVPVGEFVQVMVPLPALYLTLLNSNGSTAEKLIGVAGARVTLTDKNCFAAGEKPIKREYKTTKVGSLGAPGGAIPEIEEPGVPTGEYEICASNGTTRVKKTLIVRSMKKEGTALTMNLGEGTAGSCP